MTATLDATATALAHAHGLFRDGGALAAGHGPGRLDVMGGIADYSGSLVLQLPLARAARVWVGWRADRTLRVVSAPPEAGGEARVCTLDLDEFSAAVARGYGACRRLFDATTAWAAYVLGVLAALVRERGVHVRGGCDVLLTSTVPEAKGLSSSAAVEVATARAFARAMHLQLPARDLALLCQRAENEVVGAACGVMDQMASACGEPGQLLRLLCQPAEIEGQLTVPAGFTFLAIDSGVRHAVSGSDYTSVRVGAFMGWRMLADLTGTEVVVRDGRAEFAHPQWRGYLANVPPSAFAALSDRLPESLLGAEFLRRHGGTSDTTTRVDPQRIYAVRVPTAHPIHEHHRVRTFAALLPHAHELGVAELLGELMYQSHASYSACGLGHSATDAIVAAVRAAGPACGLYGAKITGGGSGGTVAVLARSDASLPPNLAARALVT